MIKLNNVYYVTINSLMDTQHVLKNKRILDE